MGGNTQQRHRLASTPHHAQRVLSALIAASGVAVVMVFAVRGIEGALSALDHAPGVFADFDVYMDQARRMHADPITLHEHWLYPPLLAWVLGGLAGLSTHAADGVWLWLQFGGAAALMCWAAQLMAAWSRPARWSAAFGLTAASLPLLHCLKWGQISVAVLCLSLVALRRRSLLGPVLLGVAAALKLYPLAFALLYLPRRELRAFSLACAVALVLGVLLPLTVLGRDVFLMFLARTLASALRLAVFVGVESQSWVPLVERWFGPGRGSSDTPALLFELPAAARALLGHGGAVALLAVTAWKTRRLARTDLFCLSACLLAFTIVLRPGWFHYFAILPVAQAALLSRLRALDVPLGCCVLSLLLGGVATFGYLIDPAFFYVTRSYGLVTVSALACLIGLWQVAAEAELTESSA